MKHASSLTAGLLVAATIAAVFVWRQSMARSSNGIERLVAASRALKYRPMDTRLSGGFRYLPLRTPSRSSVALGDAVPIEVAEAMLRTQALAKSQRTVENLHTLGMAKLLVGDPASAASVLAEALYIQTNEPDLTAAIRTSRNADLLNDLAAAWLAQGSATRDRVLLARGVDTALYAGTVTATPEAAWNVAVGIDALHLPNEARRRWDEYLRLDSTSPWADEARHRASEIAARIDSPPPETRYRLLSRAAFGSDENAVMALVSRFPQDARIYGEDHLLGAWASSSSRHSATQSLAAAGRLGAALRRSSGESLLHDSANLLQAAETSTDLERLNHLRKGHSAYSAGRTHYLRQEISPARDAFADAAVHLEEAGSPFSAMARLYLAGSHYYLGDRTASRRVLEQSWRAIDRTGTHHAATALTAWMLALLRLGDGQPHESLELYRLAAAKFDRLHETANRAAVANLIAENLEHLSLTAEAFAERQFAFELYRETGADNKLGQVLNGAARDAHLAGQDALAAVFLREAIRVATARNDRVTLVESLRWMLKAGVVKDEKSSAAVRRQIASVVDLVRDPGLQAALRVDVEGLVAAFDETASVAVLDAAVATSISRGTTFPSCICVADASSGRRAMSRRLVPIFKRRSA